jgi:hypothetical protein
LIALLLPAVQQAREAARRSQCLNNLKQIGLALHNYQDAHRTFPPGYIQSPPLERNEATWITQILPYVDQKPLYDKVDFNACFGCVNSTTAVNYEVVSTVLPMMLCPSDIEVGLALGGRYAKGNYVANNGIGPMRYYTQDAPPNRGPLGVMYVNSKFRMRDFLDGSSNTAMVSELLKVKGEDWRGALHYPEVAFYHHNRTPNSNIPDEIRTAACVSIDRAPCTGSHSSYSNKSMIVSARSVHPGGVHVLLGDASSRFVSENIDAATWERLGTPEDGNPLGEF